MLLRTAATLILFTSLLPTITAQGPGSRGGPPGGRAGPPSSAKTELVNKFDKDQSGTLDREERDTARAWLKENPTRGRRRGRRGGWRGASTNEPRKAGVKLATTDVKTYPRHDLYDTEIVRTLFLTFEHDDWEDEMAAFHRTDVEVPATLEADGKTYVEVGVRFRGNTSFSMVPKGQKRSLNVSIDLVRDGQRLLGYKTLNLLNCHSDPSFLREVLHAYIGRKFTPVPKANLVHVVINGESWGIYANVQQVNKDYLKEAFGSKKGARWRVPPDFSGAGGLKDLGDDTEAYERSYMAKSGVDENAWQSLVDVCKLIADTPIEKRRELLPSKLDIDGTLWFLAIDNVLLDGDGYLTRASDYMLYMDPKGIFHPVTHDNNEILGGSPMRGGARGRPRSGGPGAPRGDRPDRGRRQGGDRRDPRGGQPGRRRGPGGRHPEPDQAVLAGAEDKNRPLLHYLLEVPEWRARYLAHLHSMTQALHWDELGPEVERLHAMIAEITHADTRMLYPTEAFDASIEKLREIAGKRHASLVGSDELAGAWPHITKLSAQEITLVTGSAITGNTSTGGKLEVVAEVDTEVSGAWLHWQKKRPGPFAAIEMKRTASGALVATIPVQKPGEKIRYYVEVHAKGNQRRMAFAPRGASSMAKKHRFAKRPK